MKTNKVKKLFQNENLTLQYCTIMNIHAKKIQIIEWIASLKDPELLNKIETLKKQSVKESYEAGLTPMSMEAYEAMIASSEQDIKAGRLYSHEEVVNYIKNKK